jgi:hypothetical protein
MAGVTPAEIEGWGDVDIKVIGLDKSLKTITLHHTAYIPSFNTNLVSMKRVKTAGVR